MFVESRKFYGLSVENLKPIYREQIGESVDADNLVYVLDANGKCVILADVCVGVAPKDGDRANH